MRAGSDQGPGAADGGRIRPWPESLSCRQLQDLAPGWPRWWSDVAGGGKGAAWGGSGGWHCTPLDVWVAGGTSGRALVRPMMRFSPAPQEFLKKEFSAENVYFWQACERFQQIPEAWRIYDEFLSSHSVSPVNIDRQAWIGEEMLATPTPDMFRVQQLQIFNLMKFDSYARFVKSPLYQACVQAESEGQPLPDLRAHSRNSSPPP
uniref:RGS domain-containing protein n=1 Tax=Pelusios castaneus TaxID=367368 RepID=A0A8C8SM27_9SAUR